MSKEVFVALIDSGCDFETFEKIAIEIEENEIKIESMIKNMKKAGFEVLHEEKYEKETKK